MANSTWEHYIEAGGAEADELDDLSEVFEQQADALDTEADALEEMKEETEEAGDESFADYLEEQQDALEDASAQLRDADWETSDASEWAAAAESDVEVADDLEVEGLGHLEAAEDSLAEGDIAGAQWDLAMADSSFTLADESMETAGAELAVVGDDLDLAGDDLGGVELMDFSDDDAIRGSRCLRSNVPSPGNSMVTRRMR